MTLGERLSKTMINKGFNPNKLAVKAGVHASTINNWISNVTKPDDLKLEKVCELLKVNKQWIITGEGLSNSIKYQENDVKDEVKEPCSCCEKLKAEVKRLNDKLKDKEETIIAQKEAIAALKGEPKKEKPSTNIAS